MHSLTRGLRAFRSAIRRTTLPVLPVLPMLPMLPMLPALLVLTTFGSALATSGCKKKVTKADCDKLIDRYATLVVQAQMPDASADTLKAEQERERTAARGDDTFKACTAEVTVEEHACAMAATTPDTFEKCLE